MTGLTFFVLFEYPLKQQSPVMVSHPFQLFFLFNGILHLFPLICRKCRKFFISASIPGNFLFVLELTKTKNTSCPIMFFLFYPKKMPC